jgi:hypothetical protein
MDANSFVQTTPVHPYCREFIFMCEEVHSSGKIMKIMKSIKLITMNLGCSAGLFSPSAMDCIKDV